MFNRVYRVVLIPLISTIVNGTLLNFGKRYEDNLMVIFDQWSKLYLGLDALSNQKILNGIYCLSMSFMNIECPLQGFWVIVMQSDSSIVTKKVVARIKAMVIVELAISLHVPPTKPQESGPSQT